MSKQVIFVILLLSIVSLSLAGKKPAFKGIPSQIASLFQVSGYTIDQVLELLKQIRVVESEDLVIMDTQWAETERVISEEINTYQKLLTAKVAECEGIQGNINSNIETINTYTKYIQDAQDAINGNNKKIAELEEQRCHSNLLFIERLAESQNTVKFLQFLKQRLSAPEFKNYLNQNNGAFAEISSTLRLKKDIVGVIAKHHVLALLQQDYAGESREALEATYNVDSRTGEQVGEGHIDNDQGALERDGYQQKIRDIDAFVSQLITFIDQMIAQIQTDIENQKTAEYNAVQTLIDFKTLVERQNKVYNNYINQWTVYVKELQETLAANQQAHGVCIEGQTKLETSLTGARNHLELQRADYNQRRTTQQNTISMLDQVIALYTEKVVNRSAETYKARSDDYLDNQTFDGTAEEYERRQSSENIDDWNSPQPAA